MAIDLDLRYLFDWNRNGKFDHSRSDVSRDVENFDVRYGSAADTPSDEILMGTAVGRLVLYDRDGALNPDNPRAAVDEAVLRAPQTLRVEYVVGSTVVNAWTGRAVPQYGTSFENNDYLEWQLEGVFAAELRSDITYISQAAQFEEDPDGEEVIVEADTDDFVESLNKVATRFGLPDIATPSSTFKGGPNLGPFVYEGTVVVMLEEMAKLAGGWILENNNGELRLVTLQGAALLIQQIGAANLTTLDKTYKPSADAYLQEAPSLVKTRATLMSQRWEKVGQREVARKTISLLAGQERPLTLIGNQVFDTPSAGATKSYGGYSSSKRTTDGISSPNTISQWLKPKVIRKPDGSEVTIFTPDEDLSINPPSAEEYSVKVVSSAGGRVTLSYSAAILGLEPINIKRITNPEAEDIYGVRDYRLQPWLSQNLEGTHWALTPLINNLSEPLEYFRVTYPLRQDTVQKFQDLVRAASIGGISRMTLPTKWVGLRTVNVLVMAARITAGRGLQPLISLYGLVPRFNPPDPITAVGIEGVRTDGVFLEIGHSVGHYSDRDVPAPSTLGDGLGRLNPNPGIFDVNGYMSGSDFWFSFNTGGSSLNRFIFEVQAPLDRLDLVFEYRKDADSIPNNSVWDVFAIFEPAVGGEIAVRGNAWGPNVGWRRTNWSVITVPMREETGPAPPPTVSTAPGPVKNFAVVAHMNGIRVTWEAPDSGDPSGYEIEWSDVVDAGTFGSREVDKSKTSSIVSEVSSDTLYRVRMRALGALDNGPWTSTRSIVTGTVVPLPPSVLPDDPDTPVKNPDTAPAAGTLGVQAIILKASDKSLAVNKQFFAEVDPVIPSDADSVNFVADGLTKETDYIVKAKYGPFSTPIVVSDYDGATQAEFTTASRGPLVSFSMPSGTWKPQYITPGPEFNTVNVICDDGRIRVFGGEGTLDRTVDFWRLATGSSASGRLALNRYIVSEIPGGGGFIFMRGVHTSSTRTAYWISRDLSSASTYRFAGGAILPWWINGRFWTRQDEGGIDTIYGSNPNITGPPTWVSYKWIRDPDDERVEVRGSGRTSGPEFARSAGDTLAPFTPDYELSQDLEIRNTTEVHSRLFTVGDDGIAEFENTTSKLFDITSPSGDTWPSDIAVVEGRIGVVWQNARRIDAFARDGMKIK